MLRDKFVFGLLDDTLKERLTLVNAVEIAQRQEPSNKHIKEMSSKVPINALKGHRP